MNTLATIENRVLEMVEGTKVVVMQGWGVPTWLLGQEVEVVKAVNINCVYVTFEGQQHKIYAEDLRTVRELKEDGLVALKCVVGGNRYFTKGKKFYGRVENVKVIGIDGKFHIAKRDRFEIVDEEPKKDIPKKDIVEKVKEVLNGAKANTVILKDQPKSAVMEKLDKLQLKRGDIIEMKFLDGEEATVKVAKVGYCKKQARDNQLIERLYIEGIDGMAWNVWTTKYISVIERSTRSKKILTEGLIQFKDALTYYKAHDNAKNYFMEKKEREAKAEEIRKELEVKIGEAVEETKKARKTNRDILVKEAKAHGLILECYDTLLNKLSVANIKHIAEHIKYMSATDIVVNHNLKTYVVTMDIVDNEVDFTALSKAGYIERYGDELFTEY